MQVFTARSTETYDVEYLCDDLAKQIKENVTLQSRTLGIAVCDSTIDYKAVMKRLSEMYSFDIYGCTALAFIRINTTEDISVSFMVITGDEELVGSMAISEPMTKENRLQVIKDTYFLARERLGEEPKMILDLQPFSLDITADDAVAVLDEASGHCPIYGAVSSNDLETNISGVFVNGEFYPDRMIINLLGGGIRPVFAVANAELDLPLNRAAITNSEGNVVSKVGEDTFLEFMKKSGLITEPSYVLDSFIATYTSSPVLLYEKGAPAQDYKIRNIIDIDYSTGAVTFTGDMPKGCEIGISTLRREHVYNSSVKCFNEMIEKINKNTNENYRYSTMFSTACGGRYLIMSGDTSTEGNFITNSTELSPLATCGFYAMGEICPTEVNEDGKAVNAAHHSSITLMAL